MAVNSTSGVGAAGKPQNVHGIKNKPPVKKSYDSTSKAAFEGPKDTREIEFSGDGCQIYVIQKGDTLTSIAKRNKTSVEALFEANPHINRNTGKINIGDPLNIPTQDKTETTEQIIEPENAVIDVEPEIETDDEKTDTSPETMALSSLNEVFLDVKFDKNGQIIQCGDFNIEENSNLFEEVDIKKTRTEWEKILFGSDAKMLKDQIYGPSVNKKTLNMTKSAIKNSGKNIGKFLKEYKDINQQTAAKNFVYVSEKIFGLMGLGWDCTIGLLEEPPASGNRHYAEDLAEIKEARQERIDENIELLKNSYPVQKTSLFEDLANEWGIDKKELVDISKVAFAQYLQSKKPDELTIEDVEMAQKVNAGPKEDQNIKGYLENIEYHIMKNS